MHPLLGTPDVIHRELVLQKHHYVAVRRAVQLKRIVAVVKIDPPSLSLVLGFHPHRDAHPQNLGHQRELLVLGPCSLCSDSRGDHRVGGVRKKRVA